jgi:formylglycine-generating enzyme required for sulfatase activity
MFSGLHLETFLWMSVLSPSIKPPPGVPIPDFAAMAEKASRERVGNQWLEIKPRTFSIGINDSDNDDQGGSDDFFAWDNERNPYEVSVGGFEAQARPVSIGEYATYLVKTSQKDQLPITWLTKTRVSNMVANDQNGDEVDDFIGSLVTKTVYGHIPLSLVLDWPVYTSFKEAEGYANWVGARMPTLHEVRSIHRQVEEESAQKNESSVQDNPGPCERRNYSDSIQN